MFNNCKLSGFIWVCVLFAIWFLYLDKSSEIVCICSLQFGKRLKKWWMPLIEKKGVNTTIQPQGLLQAAAPCHWASDYPFRSFSAKGCLVRSSHSQVVYCVFSHTSCLQMKIGWRFLNCWHFQSLIHFVDHAFSPVQNLDIASSIKTHKLQTFFQKKNFKAQWKTIIILLYSTQVPWDHLPQNHQRRY